MGKIKIDTTPELVEDVYSKLEKNVLAYRKTVNRPLTLAEKILKCTSPKYRFSLIIVYEDTKNSRSLFISKKFQ